MLRRVVGGGLWGWSRRRRAEAGYGFVLIVIATTYVVSVLADSPKSAAGVLVLQMFALHVVLTTVGARRALVIVVDIVVVLTVLVLLSVALTREDIHGTGVEQTIFWVNALLYGIAPLSIVYRMLSRRTVDVQTLLAAIAAYLMIGMFFGFLYRATAASQGGSFYGTAGNGSMADDLFFSFITLTTTGYGNIVPAGNPGQTFAVVEAIVGQLFLVTAVAKVVNESGLLSGRHRRAVEEDDQADDEAAAG
jgi:hypothetical protein